jgi:hypothetical protein
VLAPDLQGLAARQLQVQALLALEPVPVEAQLLAAEPLRPEAPFFRQPDEVSLPGPAEQVPAPKPEHSRQVPGRAPISLQVRPSFQSKLPANTPTPAARSAPAE